MHYIVNNERSYSSRCLTCAPIQLTRGVQACNIVQSYSEVAPSCSLANKYCYLAYKTRFHHTANIIVPVPCRWLFHFFCPSLSLCERPARLLKVMTKSKVPQLEAASATPAHKDQQKLCRPKHSRQFAGCHHSQSIIGSITRRFVQ